MVYEHRKFNNDTQYTGAVRRGDWKLVVSREHAAGWFGQVGLRDLSKAGILVGLGLTEFGNVLSAVLAERELRKRHWSGSLRRRRAVRS